MAASSVAIASPRPRPFEFFKRVVEILPGFLLLAAVGYSGKIVEHAIGTYGKVHHVTLPNIEYVLWAILFGLAISNIFGVAPVFRAGVATYEFWLKTGIVLLGARFLLGDLLKLGGVALTLVAVELTVSLLFMTALGYSFNLKPKLTSLLAIGSSICGVSAIIAAKGAIDADDEDVSFAIAAILSLGALSLFAFPAVGHHLHLSDTMYGMWAGLGIDNTAEATAAGAIYSDAAGRVAILAKTARSAVLGFVVLGYAFYWARQGQAQHVEKPWAFLWQKFPKFILGFMLISILATVGLFRQDQITSLANVSRWAFLLSFAGVGLRTNVRDLLRQGIRPFVVGALGEVVIAALTLGMVLASGKYLR